MILAEETMTVGFSWSWSPGIIAVFWPFMITRSLQVLKQQLITSEFNKERSCAFVLCFDITELIASIFIFLPSRATVNRGKALSMCVLLWLMRQVWTGHHICTNTAYWDWNWNSTYLDWGCFIIIASIPFFPILIQYVLLFLFWKRLQILCTTFAERICERVSRNFTKKMIFLVFEAYCEFSFWPSGHAIVRISL